ncbi:MAG: HAMP domain-containing protein [Proteobacteria bacterium]|nr:HAMP domain-containing protein [Pseudomonadota bacterium]
MRALRPSLALRFGLLGALLLTCLVGAASYALVYRSGEARKGQLVDQDRQLARVLAGLRTSDGALDFAPLAAFVESVDRSALGPIYALERAPDGTLRNGALNPRAFAALDPSYREQIRAGRSVILKELAAGHVERRGRIKEYRLPVPRGTLHLGFDVRRLERQLSAQRTTAWWVLGVALLLGTLAALALARNTVRPLRLLAQAMEAVAQGDLTQTVTVGRHDELAQLAGSFNQMMQTLRTLRRLEAAHACYLPGPVRQRVLRAESARELAVEERAATILCCALLAPEDLPERAPRARLGLVNEYLAPLLDALLREGGVVLVLSERQLQAVWGVPADDPQSELRALRAAVAARAAVADRARRLAFAGQPALALAAGLCSGRVAAGNLGSVERASYVVVGDAVDHAEAIVAQAQAGEILLAESTYLRLTAEISVRAAAPLMAAGMDEALPLYRFDTLRQQAAGVGQGSD